MNPDLEYNARLEKNDERSAMYKRSKGDEAYYAEHDRLSKLELERCAKWNATTSPAVLARIEALACMAKKRVEAILASKKKYRGSAKGKEAQLRAELNRGKKCK
jgi:hypothetical protein